MKNIEKNRRSHVPFMFLDMILTQWWCPVASSEALVPFHWAMRTVTNRCIAIAIKTTSKVGVFVDSFLFACCPGSRQGNTKQVVTQWRHPVASEVALDKPHWAMLSVLSWSTAVAIKMADNRGAFVF
jgi:hypothetical protein